MLGNGVRQLEARDLSERMHARIGPARAGNDHVLPFDSRERGLELGLHRTRIRLPLEAGEIGAVVTDCYFERAHRHRHSRSLALSWNRNLRQLRTAKWPRPGFTTGRPGRRAGICRHRRWAPQAGPARTRHAEVDGPAAAIDDGRGADDLGAGLAGHVDRLARRFAGREHILDHEHAVGGAARTRGAASAQSRRSAQRRSRGHRARARLRGR